MPDPMRTQRLRLRDGRRVVLRPVAAEDADPIAGGFALLTEDEVRRRFQHPVKALGEDYLRQLTQPPAASSFVVVAAEPLPPGDALVGAVARVECDAEDPRRADFAILVSRILANQGVGRRLLARLLEWARAHGVHEVRGDVLDDNDAMLHLAERMGFRREKRHATQGVTRLVRRLRPR
jgi:RimJ/RimL family protein N-acetyltransferase